MCIYVYLSKREWHKDMLYLHQTGSLHIPPTSHLTQAVWPAVLHLILLNHKDHAHLSLQFSFYIVNKGKFVCFQLAMHALDFKTWSRHDILNLVPVEHLWHICNLQKIFQTWCTFWIRVSEPNFTASKLISIEWLLRQDLRQMLPKLLLPYQVLHVMVFFLKRCQGFCFYIGFSLTIWWCWWRKESGRVMMMLTHCWW